MKKMIFELLIVFILFFIGASCVMFLDNICLETTGEGGKLVFDVDKWGIFH